MKPLCKCKHKKSEHNYDTSHPRFCHPCGKIKLEVQGLLGGFYRIHKCGNYRPMTNLEYVEWKYEQRT